ncbi:hypothetical protein [Sinorhizobium medicae]|uniref:hypothetical protein n=1 Tax=Sinorhizobium medicae TaxID=110321 RepID=UPI0012FA254D|nr:hypothetical protein [Sinorhizobium medicae]
MQKEKLKRSNPQGESDATEADRPVSALRPCGDGAKGAGSGGRIVWNNWKQEISIGATDKPFRIEKRQVYESYKAVKAKLGAAGVDTDRAGSVCLNSFGRFAKWISATDYAAAIIGVSALK